nr:MAG TPA: hypothetical protein [Caudoviricetes sp.]
MKKNKKIFIFPHKWGAQFSRCVFMRGVKDYDFAPLVF